MAAGDVTASVNQNNGRKCASFDGVNDVLTNSNSVFKFDSSESFSIAYWFKTVDTASGNVDVVNKFIGNSGWVSYISSGGKCSVYIETNGVFVNMDGNTTIDDNKWHHCICIRDVNNDNIKIYVDGISDATPLEDVTNGSMPVNAVDLRIGNYPTNQYFNGKLTDIRIWRTALTSTEITAVYQGQQVLRGLISVWNFENGTYNDSYGNYNLTNSGTVIQIVDDNIANQLKSMRVNARSKYLLCELAERQTMLTSIEEA